MLKAGVIGGLVGKGGWVLWRVKRVRRLVLEAFGLAFRIFRQVDGGWREKILGFLWYECGLICVSEAAGEVQLNGIVFLWGRRCCCWMCCEALWVSEVLDRMALMLPCRESKS
jgi:hypothetical protein